MANPVARIGDGSDHGGVIVSSAAKTIVEGKLVARVGDLHSCPIPGHGVTAIATGSPKVIVEGQLIARTTSVAGCGAVIIGGAQKTFAA
jgi:uncharacterized Zn-binding protein involved in type VI secretion